MVAFVNASVAVEIDFARVIAAISDRYSASGSSFLFAGIISNGEPHAAPPHRDTRHIAAAEQDATL